MVKVLCTPSGRSSADLHLGAVIMAGGYAGVAMWAIAIPPDVRLSMSIYLSRTHLVSVITGIKIKNPIGAIRHLFRILRLCSQDHRPRWRGRIMERTWAGNDTSKCALSLECNGYSYSLGIPCKCSDICKTSLIILIARGLTIAKSTQLGVEVSRKMMDLFF